MSKIVDEFGHPIRSNRAAGDTRLNDMRAVIDAARTSPENARHWAGADAFSADAAYDANTRWTLRNRSRYETVNNSYAKGSVRSGADDVVGTCPRLQLLLPPLEDGTSSVKAAEKIRRDFQDWADEVQLGPNLHILEQSYERDGGGFGLFDTDPALRHPVKLDLRWLEDDFCATPFPMVTDPLMADGIRFNRLGKPVTYFFHKRHPGGPQFSGIGMGPNDFVAVPASQVVHWYPKDRFGQHRGIPENTPALPIFSQLRRYTLATLTAAEFAAMLAGVMKTAKGETELDPEHSLDQMPRFELIELVRGALLTLPNGYNAEQFKPEQPTTTYAEFKRELLNESGRASGKPLNVVSGNSSLYNFSSGRLDHLPYQRSITIKRYRKRLQVVDPIFREYTAEAFMVGIIPDGVAPMSMWRWNWHWDGFDSIDQNKDASADDTRLRNGTQTYAETYGAYGQDWQDEFQQIAAEKEYAESLGLPWPLFAPTIKAIEAVDSGNGTDPQPQQDNVRSAVEMALAAAGASETISGEVLEALAPTFALLNARGVFLAPSLNGTH